MINYIMTVNMVDIFNVYFYYISQLTMTPEDAKFLCQVRTIVLSDIGGVICFILLYGAIIVHLSGILHITAHSVSVKTKKEEQERQRLGGGFD